jgi:hypothetical protein
MITRKYIGNINIVSIFIDQDNINEFFIFDLIKIILKFNLKTGEIKNFISCVPERSSIKSFDSNQD